MQSRWIDIDTDNGNVFRGYLSLPPKGTGPGIVLIQEIWGVNSHIRAVADQYALDGYVVLAPDVFWRQKPGVDLKYDAEGSTEAFAYMKGVDFPQAVQDLTQAVNLLRGMPEVAGGVASVGYCMGGLLSYLCAANAGVDAAVCYYGGGIDSQLHQADKVSCPILFHFADNDQHISKAAVSAVKAAFANARNAVIETYPGVDHGFNCWERPSYNQQASAVAHGMSLSLLGKVL